MGVDDIAIRPDGDCVRIPVKARAGASRDAVTGTVGASLKVAVRVAPEKGRANKALAAVIADALGVKGNRVALVSGRTSVEKVFSVTGLSVGEVVSRLKNALGES